MAVFNQNPQSSTSTSANNSNLQEDKKQGAIVYFIGIIIVSVLTVGYILFKNFGLL